jgi:hypothetical protein
MTIPINKLRRKKLPTIMMNVKNNPEDIFYISEPGIRSIPFILRT